MRYGEWMAVPTMYFKYEVVRNVYDSEKETATERSSLSLRQQKYPRKYWFFKNAKAKAEALNMEE